MFRNLKSSLPARITKTNIRTIYVFETSILHTFSCMHFTLTLSNSVGISEQKGMNYSVSFYENFFGWGKWMCMNLKNYTHWMGKEFLYGLPISI